LHGVAGGVELGNGFDLEADCARATIDDCYGVRQGNAAAARPSFGGHSSWRPEVGLLVRYRASPRQVVFANLNHER
jgi:hypothetical protein